MEIWNNKIVAVSHKDYGKCEVTVKVSLFKLQKEYEYNEIDFNSLINLLNNVKS